VVQQSVLNQDKDDKLAYGVANYRTSYRDSYLSYFLFSHFLPEFLEEQGIFLHDGTLT
jgi:hypothetical protein